MFHNTYDQKEQHHFILKVNKENLKEINQSLFKDDNYYFFYNRILVVPENEMILTHRDSVPTMRTTTPLYKDCRTKFCSVSLNRFGYINVIETGNPIVAETQDNVKLVGDISPFVFFNLTKSDYMMDSDFKELCAVLFWNYLCFCGGVDFGERRNSD